MVDREEIAVKDGSIKRHSARLAECVLTRVAISRQYGSR
jgi:hypothetical protein